MNYISKKDTIIILSDRDKVRQRPGMYIGDIDETGLQTIIREVIDNAADEYPNYSDPTKPIEVTVHEDDSISVRDYGRGISPYESQQHPGNPEERLAFTVLGAGGKFDVNRADNGNQFSGGMHGVGASATNFMSEYFDVKIWKDGKEFHDRFENGGIPVIEPKKGVLPSIKSSELQGTRIHFKPDASVMNVTSIDVDYLDKLLSKITYLTPGLKIIFRNNRDSKKEKVYYAENGIVDYLDVLSEKKYTIKPYKITGELETTVKDKNVSMLANVAIAFSDGENHACEPYTNGIYNGLGGTHVDGLYEGIKQLLAHYYQEFKTDIDSKYKKQIDTILTNSKQTELFKLVSKRHISPLVYSVIDFKHTAPILAPQTKDKLTSKEATDMVKDLVFAKSMLYLDKQIPLVQNLIGKIIESLYESSKLSASSVKLDKKSESILSSKFADASSKDVSKKELFLVEGDSAGGTAKEKRDSRYQALLALRGKVLNTQRATLEKTLANTELATLLTVLGTGYGSNFDLKNLKYNKIIIATDQDVDGLHIRVLLITFFMKFLPELVLNGHLYYADTPLYVNYLKKDDKAYYTYSEEEQLKFVSKHKSKIVETNRNKGLGELDPEEVQTTLLDEKTRKITQLQVSDMDELMSLIDTLMSTESAGRKSLFLKNDYKPTAYDLMHAVDVNKVFKDNFFTYGMHVIEDRALPDVRDGLKPVHRNIIYEMLRSKNLSTSKTIKVMKIVGNVMGFFHPHGDSSITEALVNLAIPWKNTLAPIHIKGNKGSVYGDTYAAARYIEARLTPTGDSYGKSLKEGIVPYQDNYDGTMKQPTILPAQLPYLLMNGTQGIAVGVSTNIPPHNPIEVIEGFIAYAKNPKITTEELVKIIPGPDFPTGGVILNTQEMQTVYETGIGKVSVRGKVLYDEKDHSLRVYELPYTSAGNMYSLVEEITLAQYETQVKNSKTKKPAKLPWIQSVHNYSGNHGIDIRIKLQKGINPEMAINELFAKTSLETSFRFEFQALNNKKLRHYGLSQYFNDYLQFQHTILRNEYRMIKEDTAHDLEIIEGLLKLQDYIDEVIASAKVSNGRSELKEVLMTGKILKDVPTKFHKKIKTFRFSELQAENISSLPLYRINKLDVADIKKKQAQLQKQLEEANSYIESEVKRKNLIIKRHEENLKLLDPKEFKRRTELTDVGTTVVEKQEIPEVPWFVSMNKYNYVTMTDTPHENSLPTTNKRRLGFIDSKGIIYNYFMDNAKPTKGMGVLVNTLVGTDDVVGCSINISEDEAYGLYIFEDGHVRLSNMSTYYTKSRSSKVTAGKTTLPISVYIDVPKGAKTVTINNKTLDLSKLTVSKSGNGSKLVPSSDEYEVTFDTTHEVSEMSTVNDCVVIFDKNNELLFEWNSLDTNKYTGMYVTTYQELLTQELVFIDVEGKAKVVSGSEFEVTTKRSKIQANKKDFKALYIAPLTDTLLGKYKDGSVKRIDTSLLSRQSKVGGGSRAFYSPKHELISVEDGKGSNVELTSLATQPKKPV